MSRNRTPANLYRKDGFVTAMKKENTDVGFLKKKFNYLTP